MTGPNGGRNVAAEIEKPGVRERLIDRLLKDNLTFKNAQIGHDLDSLAGELAGPDPIPIERTLAEVAATCWLDLRMKETNYALVGKKGISRELTECHQKLINHAHRRLMSTLRTLAVVRKLAVPAIQVNVARQQINQQVVAVPGGP
jgi:hypothetical protein